jgi:hypothetical protein
MNQQQIKNLAKRLCIKNNCKGFLKESIDSKKNQILRCIKCHHFLYLDEVEMLLVNYEVDEILDHDSDDNLKALNNYDRK